MGCLEPLWTAYEISTRFYATLTPMTEHKVLLIFKMITNADSLKG